MARCAPLRLLVTVAAMGMGVAQASSAWNVLETSILSAPRQAGFLDKDVYRVDAVNGSPLGLLDPEMPEVSAEVGYRFWETHPQENSDSARILFSSIHIPRITIASPGRGALRLYFNPGSRKFQSVDSNYTLPLYRFGFHAAGGSPKGIFQGGMGFDGYYGKALLADFTGNRVAMGIDRLSLHLGSQVHELVRVGFNFTARVWFDSLRNVEQPQFEDRYVEGALGGGGDIDFGKRDFPVMSNFALQYAKTRFAYVSKPAVEYKGRKDPIIADSLVWNWLSLVEVPAKDFTIRPGFRVGYVSCNHQVFSPDTGDLSTMQWFLHPEHQERAGQSWDVKALRFGLGSAVAVMTYGEVWFGYWHTGLKVDYQTPTPRDFSEGYDGGGFGLTGFVHAIPQLRIPESMRLDLRIGYTFDRENMRWESLFGRDFREVNSTFSAGSQLNRYPSPGHMPGDQKVGIFTLGIGAGFLDGMFSLDAAWRMLNFSSIKRNGNEIQLVARYELRSQDEPKVKEQPAANE